MSSVMFVIVLVGFCFGNPGGTTGAVPLSVEVLSAPLASSVLTLSCYFFLNFFLSCSFAIASYLLTYFSVCWVILKLQSGHWTISLSLSLCSGLSSTTGTSSSLICYTGSFVILILGFAFAFALYFYLTTGLSSSSVNVWIPASWTGSSSLALSSISYRVCSSSDFFTQYRYLNKLISKFE